jgi:hypothetical protein
MPGDAWSLRPWLEPARRHGVRARAREFHSVSGMATDQINRRFLGALERADDFVEAIGNCSAGALSHHRPSRNHIYKEWVESHRADGRRAPTLTPVSAPSALR